MITREDKTRVARASEFLAKKCKESPTKLIISEEYFTKHLWDNGISEDNPNYKEELEFFIKTFIFYKGCSFSRKVSTHHARITMSKQQFLLNYLYEYMRNHPYFEECVWKHERTNLALYKKKEIEVFVKWIGIDKLSILYINYTNTPRSASDIIRYSEMFGISLDKINEDAEAIERRARQEINTTINIPIQTENPAEQRRGAWGTRNTLGICSRSKADLEDWIIEQLEIGSTCHGESFLEEHINHCISIQKELDRQNEATATKRR